MLSRNVGPAIILGIILFEVITGLTILTIALGLIVSIGG